MTILAVEFSSNQRSVAVARRGTVLARVDETGGRTAHALTMIDRALASAQLERESITCLAVGRGPGSYAGIRAAIALAQGWQLATGVQLLGISTVDCMAAQASASGITGRAAFAIDAQRDEFYLATYELADGRYQPVVPIHIASFEQVVSETASEPLFVWPELQPRWAGSRALAPDAAVLARLASTRTDFVAGADLEPIYLREASFTKAPPLRHIPEI